METEAVGTSGIWTPGRLAGVELSERDLELALHFGIGVPAGRFGPDFSPEALRESLAPDDASTWLRPIPASLAPAADEIRKDNLSCAAPDGPQDGSLDAPLYEATLAALKRFREGAATPEQRLMLAEITPFSYDDLTTWLIRADLMRLEAVNADRAELLALAGVRGIHDLAQVQVAPAEGERCRPTPETELRIEQLRARFAERIARLGAGASVDRLRARWAQFDPRLQEVVLAACHHARRYEPQAVTTTEVVLVVKGAGMQGPDETLDGFLQGFLPAVKALSPRAVVGHRHDIFPPGFRASAHDEASHAHVSEVHAGERRIWLKESHWEVELRPPPARTALANEWRMATYAFANLIYELMGVPPKPGDPVDERRVRGAFRLTYLALFAFLYFIYLNYWYWLSVLLLWRQRYEDAVWNSEQGVEAFPQDQVGIWLPLYLISIVAGIALVALLAYLSGGAESDRTVTLLEEHNRHPNRPWERAPSISLFLLYALIVVFALNPLRYLIGIGVLVLTLQGVLLARDRAWPYRTHPHSDTRRPTDRPATWREALLLSPLLYRYLVILGLPIIYFLLLVAELLSIIPAQIPLLGSIGPGLRGMLRALLSSGLGDVNAYATDPAQAHRVRSAVEGDLRFFHERPDVSAIHVVSHSQGTPITFETLFHHLPDRMRRKVRTYVTIGSVLSYYHQANAVLDKLRQRRFPVRPYPPFSQGFRWINLWNLYDPIPEYYALDEYEQVEPAAAGTGAMTLQRASPTDIQTGGHWLPWHAHSEYWENLPHMHLPLVSRLLGDDDPVPWQRTLADGWTPTPPPRGTHPDLIYGTARRFVVAYLLLVILLWGLTVAIWNQVVNWGPYVAARANLQARIEAFFNATWPNAPDWLPLLPERILPSFTQDLIWVLLMLILVALISRLRPTLARR